MKLGELKQALKPFIKECIKEALLEKGILSNIVKEVVEGVVSSSPILESRSSKQKPVKSNQIFNARKEKKSNYSENRKLLESVGRELYNGVNIFEGTTPLAEGRAMVEPNTGTTIPSPLSGIDPNDPGVPLDLFGFKDE